MIVRPIKTAKILAGQNSILEILDEYLPLIKEGSVVAVTSKVIALCENRIAPMDKVTVDELIEQEASLFTEMPNKYGQRFTVTNDILVGKSGIDKNSKRGYYILWPKDPQATANQIRDYLAGRFGLKNVGVVITDSVSTPMRYGVIGIALAHSGFEALNTYKYSQANISGGLAAAAVVAMGEGTEHTPIAIIENNPLIKFQDRNPTAAELDSLKLTVEDDFFGLFLSRVDWQKGLGR